MPSSLPPLNALRVFEASARLRSFKKASEELYVTPSAISQQIKLLEDHLGVVLFNRAANGVSMTPEGQKLLPVLEVAFNDITAAITELKQDSRQILRLSAPPALAAIWLVARLTQFEVDHPNIVTNLHSSLERVNFNTDGFDCAIRVFFAEQIAEGFARMQTENLQYELLMDSELFCVCNPDTLRDKSGRNRVPECVSELGNFNLLHFRDYTTWSLWAESYHSENLYTTSGIISNTVDGLCTSLIKGQGVALVDSVILTSEKYANQLTPLFQGQRQQAVSDNMSYYFIAPTEHWDKPSVSVMRHWLLEKTKGIVGHYAFEHS